MRAIASYGHIWRNRGQFGNLKCSELRQEGPGEIAEICRIERRNFVLEVWAAGLCEIGRRQL
jgi:hypothetical protein